MRRIIIALAFTATLTLGLAPAATAHVHGITPLLELGCKVDNGTTGANAVNGGPADAANGGPISGLIPSSVGEAALGFGDGGFGAANDNVCP